MDLFDLNGNEERAKPLAERMRANNLNEFIGQRHIVAEGSLLRRAISLDRLGSCIFWGPPGTGKTTLANIIASTTHGEFIKLNAVQAGVADVKKAVEQANILDMMDYFQVTLMNPNVLVGAFIGAMMAFLFCGLTMNAVGRAAQSMVNEVRRQFREIKGILQGEATPDYARCVEISTKGAQREMLFPSLLAIVVSIAVGFIFGVAGVMGLLIGSLSAGFVLAVFMANSGGAWDNAKKYIEEGNFGGKGSDNHKATVVGDTVGDPFKDTSGPSLNILIKLMSMVSIVVAGLTVWGSLF